MQASERQSGELAPNPDKQTGLVDITAELIRRRYILVAAPVIAGAVMAVASAAITPTFTAKTTFLPPQQQTTAGSALASLSALTSLAGGSSAARTPSDQYISLMKSNNVSDRIIDRFKLMDVYNAKFRYQARLALDKQVRIAIGKKDGLITVETDANDAAIAADMANQYVVELRRITSDLALTEAQQRRTLFEGELKKTRDKMAEAQQKLQDSGFDAGAMKADPKSAAEGYARIKALVTAAEVRLQTMRRLLTDGAPEIQQQSATLAALQSQLQKLEVKPRDSSDPTYINNYREYKYQEALFELLSKQYETARLDESREGALIQVVDVAMPPEKKSKPHRALLSISASLLTLVALCGFFLARLHWRAMKVDGRKAQALERLLAAWRGQ